MSKILAFCFYCQSFISCRSGFKLSKVVLSFFFLAQNEPGCLGCWVYDFKKVVRIMLVVIKSSLNFYSSTSNQPSVTILSWPGPILTSWVLRFRALLAEPFTSNVLLFQQVLQINNENVAGYSESKVHDIIKKAGVNNIVLAVRDRSGSTSPVWTSLSSAYKC